MDDSQCVPVCDVYLYSSFVCTLQLIPNYEYFMPNLVNLEGNFPALIS